LKIIIRQTVGRQNVRLVITGRTKTLLKQMALKEHQSLRMATKQLIKKSQAATNIYK
jgi:hypothetical protein